MYALVVTPLHRQYGRPMASWAVAFRRYEQAGGRFDHIKLFGSDDDADGHDVVVSKYQQAQQMFLAGAWDVMVTLEDDMVLPEDAFIRMEYLLNSGADIGYGLYVWRHMAAWWNRWNAYQQVPEEAPGVSIAADIEHADRLFSAEHVADVAGVGLGFTGIKRHVLETIAFQRRGRACNDWYLAVDAGTRGYVQRCDFGLRCGHFSLTPSPRILWPAVNDDMQFVEHV